MRRDLCSVSISSLQEQGRENDSTHIMVRLMKETKSIMVQLGTTLSPQRTYATGTDTPYLTNSPSKGWKYPSFLVNWLLS